jgi:hypothetical protein
LVLRAELACLSGLVYWNLSGRVTLAQFHQRCVYSDACQPSGKSRPSVKILQVKECVKEAFLNGVLGVLAISQNAISNTEHLFGMTLIQIIEGTAVTNLRGCHKPLVAHHAEIVG